MDSTTAAALNLTLLLAAAFVCWRMVRLELRMTRDELEGMRDEMRALGRRVDTATQANAGARIMAQNAIARAERAEVAASKPVVLVVSPANDASITTARGKTQ